MFDAIREKVQLKKIAAILVYVLIFYRMVLNLIYSTEQPYQTPKDFYFLIASLWFTLLVFAFRRIPLRKVAVWGTLLVGAVVLLVYYKIYNVSVQAYGKVYFLVILFSWIICIAFVALIVDSLTSVNTKRILLENRLFFVIFSVMAVFMIIYGKTSIIPVLCPIIALMLTDIKKNKWLDITKFFAAGYYIAFAQTMTKSLIQNPDRYQGSRYLGSFMELESGGMFCGGAVVCMLFFVALYVFSDSKKWYKLAIPLVLMLYPLYAVWRITSRSTQISLLLVLLFFFIFCHTRGKKASLIRGAVSIGIFVVMVVTLFVYSSVVKEQYDSGKKVKLSYWEGHIYELTAEEGRVGYFKDGSILNAIDKLSSKRLEHWVESSKQIQVLGHPFVTFYFKDHEVPTESPHNFYILWLIEYGAIGGAFVILWILYVSVVSGRTLAKCDSYAVMTFLWAVFFMGVCMFTCVRWKSPLAFSLLILQYGVLIKREE